jgi:acyl dehydratase
MVGKFFDEFQIGDQFTTPSRTVTETDVVMFAGLSADYSPHHTDEEFCKTLPQKRKFAHGLLGVSICSGLIVSLNLWRDTALALLELTVRFKAPVMIGDTITVLIKVANKKESKKGDKGVITFDQTVKNQKGDAVIEMQWLMMIRTKQIG